jgi:hypothetical protein
MDEHVIAALVRCDEAEALLIVVEFHGATGHVFAFRNVNARELPAARRLPLLAIAEVW